MRKIYLLLFITLITVININCSSGQLKKDEIIKLTDKKFYLTAVNVDVSDHKLFFQKGIGIDSNMLKDIFSALPTEELCKILSNELKLEIDNSDFVKDLKISSPNWKSNKKDVNSITIQYELSQLSGGGMTFGGSYLLMYYSITIKTISGSSKVINLKFPEKENTAYNPMYVAREKGLNSADVAKMIIMEEIKNIPTRLISYIKNMN